MKTTNYKGHKIEKRNNGGWYAFGMPSGFMEMAAGGQNVERFKTLKAAKRMIDIVREERMAA